MSKQKNNFKTSKVYNTKHLESNDGTTDLNVIDIFDVPNALDVIKSSIKSHRETISTSCLSKYDQLPMLVVIHKSFPRVVSYNGSVGAEVGI